MTTIDKLSLLGIRSYGTEEETLIKFYKPLTIILGRNGSGKSTIIEAVKMATTGEVMPSFDKATFIHDPRIYNDTETKARIRLAFTNVRGDQYIISRHFQLVLKRTPKGLQKLEFKSLARNIKRCDTQGGDTNNRCADLDAYLPELLRVTKPVLNNVIFVHQEDSLWPLSGSKNLKTKLDEIFASSRYTKALETIRSYKREQDAEIRVVDADLMRYGDKVQLLEKIKAEVDEIRVYHDQLKKGVATLDNEIAQLKSKRNAARAIADEYNEKTSDLAKLKIEASMIEKDKRDKYAEMQNHLPDMDEDALATEIEELEGLLESAGSERARRERLIKDLRADVEMKQDQFNVRQGKKGMLEQQAKMQAERLARLETMKEEFCSKDLFNQDSGSGRSILPSQSDSLSKWTEALMALHNDAEAQVRSTSESGSENLEAATAALNEVKIELRESSSSSKQKSEELSRKRRKISEIRNELHALDDSESTIKEAESKLKTVERMWKEKTASNRAKALADSIATRQQKLAPRREKLAELRRVRDDLVQNQSEQARYEMSREAEGRKKKKAENTAEDFSELLLSSLSELGEDEGGRVSLMTGAARPGVPLTEANGEEKLGELLDTSISVLARKDKILQQVGKRESEAQANLKSASKRLAELENHFKQARKEWRESQKSIEKASNSLCQVPPTAVGIEDVTALLQEISLSSTAGQSVIRPERIDSVHVTIENAETFVVKANQQISQLESGVLLAEGDLEKFESDPKHRCPACGVSSSKKLEDMRKSLKNRVEYFKNPDSTRKAERELRNLEETVRTLKKVHKIGTVAVAAIRQYESTKEKYHEGEKIVSKHKTEVSEAGAALQDLQGRFGNGSAVEQVSPRSIELKQIFKDWDRARMDVQTLQSSIAATTAEARTLSEVEEETRTVEEELQKLQESIEKDASSLEREREDLRRAENRMSMAKQRCLELQTMAEKHKRLKNEKEQLTDSVRDLESQIRELQNKTKKLRVNVEDAEAECMTVREESKASLRKANSISSKRKMAFHTWEDCVRGVDAYNHSGKDRELRNVIKSLEKIQADIESRKKDLEAHRKEQETASDSQKEMESRIRNLKDNQRYRIQEQKLQVNARSARHLQDEITSLYRRANGDPNRQVEALVDEINEKHAARLATQGKQQVYTDMFKDKRKALEEAERHGSRRKYDEYRIRKQTMSLASGDLEKYHRALDQALVAYHTLKMNSINRTIKELWQQTYRGTDIEEIEIVSDHGDPSAAGAGRRRTFTYRVQMRRGQATLDMAGRCSAGQKVLACLVIRLALAESFCTDCGILALDEPTTNLDRENIMSLAEALKNIINSRRKQRNFQLVLITHDREFIDLIGARNFCDDYFMVYKDSEGISHAQAQPLQEM